MIDTEIIEKLIDFSDGDLVTLVEIQEMIKRLCESRSSDDFCDFYKKLANYIPLATRHQGGEPFFNKLGKLFKRLNQIEEREGLLTMNEEVLMILKEIEPYFENNPSIDEETKSIRRFQPDFSFTKEEEKAISYDSVTDDRAIMETYVEEASEFLDSAQFSLLDLEHDPDNEEAINRVFRCFHTIKSSSAFLGFKNIEITAHHVENMLGLVRNKSMRITPELIDVLFYGINHIRNFIDVITQNSFEKEKIISVYRAIALVPYIQIIESIVFRHKEMKIGEILADMGTIDDSIVKKILMRQDREGKRFGEIALEEDLISHDQLDEAVKKQNSLRTRQNFVKVSSEKLNLLVNMVGELVVNQSMLRDRVNERENGEQSVKQMELITTTIKDIVLSMGMIPVIEVFQKLRIVIRNTARELGKLVDLEIEGGETELDRNLIESIYDPLVHIVRNSVSHGIEEPRQREQSGKNTLGKIKIIARYKGNGVEISVEDDGKGIDPVMVFQKALEMGLIEADEEKTFMETPEELYPLLFHPGFSTKKKADSISGRGVGLDVVQQNVSKINGKIEIHSHPGKGTQFIIKLPLTLAIIDGFVTEISGGKFIFPFDTIEEILVPADIKKIDMESGLPMVLSRDRHIPIIDLKKLLQSEKSVYSGRFVYILVNYDERLLAVPVDRVIGKKEIVIKNLNEVIRQQKIFSGGTIFGDGSIGFILDFEEIIDRVNTRQELIP